jgi:hypothetical protein
LNLESTNGSPGTISHVEHVNIQNADFEMATWSKNTLAFGDCEAINCFGSGDRKPEDHSSKEAFGKGEWRRNIWMIYMAVVGQ